MKKFLSMALALAMAAALAVPAFADDTITSVTTGSNTATSAVKVNVTSTSDSDSYTETYYIVVAWTDTDVSYTRSQSGATWHWDGADGVYKKDSASSWSKSLTDSEVKVTVTNRSGLGKNINAAVAYSDATNGTSCTFDTASKDLDSIVMNHADNYTSASFNSQVFTGTFNMGNFDPTSTVQTGTITVTITDKA